MKRKHDHLKSTQDKCIVSVVAFQLRNVVVILTYLSFSFHQHFRCFSKKFFGEKSRLRENLREKETKLRIWWKNHFLGAISFKSPL